MQHDSFYCDLAPSDVWPDSFAITVGVLFIGACVCVCV